MVHLIKTESEFSIMSTNLISVILPTYNRKHIIQEAMDSVLNQTYENLELIIVDDGSTDNTNQLIHTYTDSRIKYIYLKKSRGMSCKKC